MKWILNILFFSLSIPAFSQVDTLNRLGPDNKKTGYWIYYGKDKPERGYADNDIYEEGNYLNGQKSGKWISYYKGNKLWREMEFVNGRPGGKFNLYFENGLIEESGTWKSNHYTDTYFRYHPNGKIARQGSFNSSGKTDGWQYWYHANGDLELKYYARNGNEVLDSGITGTKPIQPLTDLEYKMFPVLSDQALCLCNINEVLYPYITIDQNGDSLVAYSTSYYFIKLIGKFKSSRMYNGTCYVEVNGEETKLYIHNIENGRLQNAVNPSNETTQSSRAQYTKYYNSNKQIEFDGYYLEGKFYEGKQYIYDENGLLKQIKVFKEGKHVGDAPLN